MTFVLAISAFVAGLITFLAPCTLPLVPGYLGFISGVAAKDIGAQAPALVRRRVLRNALGYVLGFSLIFIFLGSLAGLGGRTLIHYRLILARIGGLLIIIFGLALMRFLPGWLLRWLDGDHRSALALVINPGTPTSSFLFGAVFAFGWTPCVGPIMASILLLAATTATVASGALLLAIFSLGLAVPFLVMALFIGQVTPFIRRYQIVLRGATTAGGLLLVVVGWLLLTDSFASWIGFTYQTFRFIRYDRLLDYL